MFVSWEHAKNGVFVFCICICICILPWESGDICILGTYADAVDVVKGGRCKAKLLLIGRPKITQICESRFLDMFLQHS